MRIHIAAMGSRGDVVPLVALGQGLQAAGHQVSVTATADFADLITAAGLVAKPISITTTELLSSQLGKDWLAGSSDNLRRQMRLAKEMVATWGVKFAPDVAQLVGTADLFISGLLSAYGAQALAEASGARHVLALLAPMPPTRAGWAGMAPPRPGAYGLVNLIASQMGSWVVADTFRASGEAVRRELGLPRGSLRDVRRSLLQTPTVVGVSELVVPRPADWPDHAVLTGYWHPSTSDTSHPEAEAGLQEWLSAGDPPLYIGFGSMPALDPQAQLREIGRGLGGRRAVIHRGGSGYTDQALTRAGLGSHVRLVGETSHDWLFPQCAAVIHHGGAGTTAAALRAGVPSGVVAHMGDQPFWGRRVHELGVGARPSALHEFTPARLAQMIAELDEPALRGPAAILGERLCAEDGVARAVNQIEEFIA